MSEFKQRVSKHRLFIVIVEYGAIIIGSLIQAVAMRLFLIPGLLVSGGVSGAAQLINYASGFPVGLMTLIGNIPLFIIGWHYLGKGRFAIRTAVSVIAFSLFTDFLLYFIPGEVKTNDPVLDTLYGGLILGLGLGLVYRGRGTSGGSDILSRVLNRRFHLSVSQTYLIVDGLVVLASGFVFDWRKALYGLLVIYISGLAAEMVSEGSSILRNAIIVSNKPEQIAHEVMTVMERGVTILPGTGAYSGLSRPVLYIVVTRSEVSQLKALVLEADPKAFMVIGSAHEALGEGFQSVNHL